MRVRAVVSSVRTLEARDGKDAPTFVSLEGFSVLLGREAVAPVEGSEISGVVQVRWKEHGRPTHILSNWSAVA